MKGNWNFSVLREPYNRPSPFALWQENPDGRIAIVQNFVMQVTDEGQSYPPSTPSLPTEAYQAMIEGLWKAGFRPTGYQEPREHIASINRHLEDFRAIAFKLIKVHPPA